MSEPTPPSTSGRRQLPDDLAAAVPLGGEMGRCFAEFDWAAHPLGPPADWSPEIRTAVAVALTSRFPIVLWLDPTELFLMYNDAYAHILGDKHPAALGLPAGRCGRRSGQRSGRCWPGSWRPAGPPGRTT
ncbi:hypothetical protein NIIDMKKI_68010 [Mycobacterium kansasii]|uniref:Putative pAS/PAC sensor hybrid histidine kinase n=1 Tax=Mycobacterium kansasii TaxID=1768 RepID=A0A1V3WQ75_MYCKA|nr:putative pAS/PAC sensor hybrid histidine kinase [Mycobacterium kansasii]BCI91595.1 hypothetical protein NIIDMKKI_68010 [Mycobacterium kansasii]